MVHVFLSTQNAVSSELHRTFWPSAGSKVWPTYLLLTYALVDLVFTLLTLLFYCCAYEKRVKSWKCRVALYATEAVFWIVVTVLYRTEKTRDDLWGWSCTDTAQLLEETSLGEVPFRKLCDVQVCLSSGLCPGQFLVLVLMRSIVRFVGVLPRQS